MKLPLADDIEPSKIGKRVPKMGPHNLGSYVEHEGSVQRDFGYNDVWRTEVRIGVQTHLDPLMPLEKRDQVYRDTKGMVLRHVYSTVYNELKEVLDDFYNSGIYRGNPAYDRVVNMLETFDDAFRGEY